jgi:PadR family transcriptional regulator, regulatory protein PadR
VVVCLLVATRKEADRIQLLQGTLDLLILQTLIFGPRHGHGIATTIERTSEEVLLIDHGSLYPALQRLEQAGLIASEWGTSENNRRARFYRLTRSGRARLATETGKWAKMVRAVARILEAGSEEGS